MWRFRPARSISRFSTFRSDGAALRSVARPSFGAASAFVRVGGDGRCAEGRVRAAVRRTAAPDRSACGVATRSGVGRGFMGCVFPAVPLFGRFRRACPDAERTESSCRRSAPACRPPEPSAAVTGCARRSRSSAGGSAACSRAASSGSDRGRSSGRTPCRRRSARGSSPPSSGNGRCRRPCRG